MGKTPICVLRPDIFDCRLRVATLIAVALVTQTLWNGKRKPAQVLDLSTQPTIEPVCEPTNLSNDAHIATFAESEFE